MVGLRKRREYFDDMHKEMVDKCFKIDNKTYKSCQEAADFHYRRCLTDQFSADECKDEVYEALKSYCKDKAAAETELCQNLITTTSTPSTSTTTTTTTEKPSPLHLLRKTSNVVTVSIICGMILLFIIMLIVWCCCRRRAKKKEAEKGWGFGLTPSTSSDGTKTTDEGSSWDFALNGTTEPEKETTNGAEKTAIAGTAGAKSEVPKVPVTSEAVGTPGTPVTPKTMNEGALTKVAKAPIASQTVTTPGAPKPPVASETVGTPGTPVTPKSTYMTGEALTKGATATTPGAPTPTVVSKTVPVTPGAAAPSPASTDTAGASGLAGAVARFVLGVPIIIGNENTPISSANEKNVENGKTEKK